MAYPCFPFFYRRTSVYYISGRRVARDITIGINERSLRSSADGYAFRDHDGVVDKAGGADAGGEEDEGGTVDGVEFFERLFVGDGDVVESEG